MPIPLALALGGLGLMKAIGDYSTGKEQSRLSKNKAVADAWTKGSYQAPSAGPSMWNLLGQGAGGFLQGGMVADSIGGGDVADLFKSSGSSSPTAFRPNSPSLGADYNFQSLAQPTALGTQIGSREPSSIDSIYKMMLLNQMMGGR